MNIFLRTIFLRIIFTWKGYCSNVFTCHVSDECPAGVENFHLKICRAHLNGLFGESSEVYRSMMDIIRSLYDYPWFADQTDPNFYWKGEGHFHGIVWHDLLWYDLPTFTWYIQGTSHTGHFPTCCLDGSLLWSAWVKKWNPVAGWRLHDVNLMAIQWICRPFMT